jgi:hypothetical protein
VSSPSIAATGSSSQTADSTSHTMPIPSGTVAGSLLVAVFTFDGGPTITGWPADWVVFPRGTGPNGTNGAQVAYLFAAGGESNFTLTTSAAEESNSRCYRITGHAGPTRPPLVSLVGISGPGAVTPAVSPHEWAQPQDILSIVALGWENTTPTPTPSGYTNEFNNHTGGAGGTGIRCETQAITGFTGTENPADYTTGSGDRTVWTILIPSDADDPDFTYPIVRHWFGRSTNSGSSSVVVLLPLQREAGDILLAAIGLITNVTISSGLPSGWTTEVSVVGGGAGGERMYVLWKRADGTETDFTLTMSGSSAWALLSCAVINMSEDTDVISGTATGNDANPDAPNLSADSDLWAAVIQHEGRTVVSFPANYTHRQESHGTAATIAIAFRQLTATSENPGTYTDSGSANWTAATLALGKANPRYFQAAWWD